MDALQAIGDPDLRQALRFVRAASAPVTVDELAGLLGIHRNVARARLDRLVESALLEVHFERRTGRSGPGAGRPSRVYTVAPELSAHEFPFRRYGTLIELLISSLPARGRDKRLQEVGAAFGQELARSAGVAPAATLPAAAAAVCSALGDLGFHAAVEEAGADEAWIRTATCPLRPLVVADRSAIAVDSGMWAGLIDAALAGVDAVDVECEGHDCLGEHDACRMRIRVRPVSLRRER